jgi:hypothetical protein
LKWTSDYCYDFILAWDSLFHLPTADQPIVVKKICTLLAPGGVALYTFGDAVGDMEDLSFRDGQGGQLCPV